MKDLFSIKISNLRVEWKKKDKSGTLYAKSSWNPPLSHNYLAREVVWETALIRMALRPLGWVIDPSQSMSDG